MVARSTTALALLCLAGFASAQSSAQSGATRKRTVELYLPLEFGTRWSVAQGQNMGPSHNDKWNRYALDFDLPVGTAVHAAADGVVVVVKEDSTGPTGNAKDNNRVIVRHADGTAATYAHLKKDGALVAVGDRVLAGDHIGWSGNTGKSTGPHLHFNLFSSHPHGVSIPFEFAEFPKKGVPRMGESPLSLNYPVRRVIGGLLWLREAYELCQKLDRRDALAGLLKSRIQKKQPPADLRRLVTAASKRGRTGLEKLIRKHRDALHATYTADHGAQLKTLAAALREKRHAAAMRTAYVAILDYSWLDLGPFRRAQSTLGRDAASKDAVRPVLKELNGKRSARRALTKAFEAAWKLRTLTGKRATTQRKRTRKLFAAIKDPFDEKQKAALQKWLAHHVR